MRAAISLLVMGLLFASYAQTNSERLFSSRGSGRIVPDQEQLMAKGHKSNEDHHKPYRGAGRRRAYSSSTHTA